MMGFIKKMTKKKLFADHEDEIDYEHKPTGPFSLPKNEILRCQISRDQNFIFTPYY